MRGTIRRFFERSGDTLFLFFITIVGSIDYVIVVADFCHLIDQHHYTITSPMTGAQVYYRYFFTHLVERICFVLYHGG
jgi:hypothetical protein